MKARFHIFFGTAALAATLALAACSKAPNDAQLISNIQARLGADSGLQNKALTVQSEKGTVTLSGTVDNDAQRDAAAKYAASEPGVKTVVNNLQVASTSASAEPAQEPAAATAEPAPQAAPEPAPAARDRKPARASKPSPSAKHAYNSGAQEPAQSGQAQAAAPAASQMAAAQPASATPPPPPEPKKVTIPSGTTLAVRLVDQIDTATAQTGDSFHATLDSPVAVDGDVVVPAHYDVDGHIVAAQSSGKFAGKALLELQLDRIRVGDRWYNIQTDHFKQETGSRGKNTAAKVGGGAVAGAILGGIFGGGKGAAIGSVAGAGAGGGVQAASKKPDIKLSSERILTFTLQGPVTIVPTTKPAREGRRLESSNDQ
ncbi:MAG TPA: BON domain-containing protein [Terriglobales bacterium]|nr:BON domain-containing protein [Terriglobales bacterium]